MLLGIDAAFLAQVMYYALLFKIAAVKWDTLRGDETGLPKDLSDMDFNEIRQACSLFFSRTNDFLFGEPSQNRSRAP